MINATVMNMIDTLSTAIQAQAAQLAQALADQSQEDSYATSGDQSSN